jgi:hypothetical protein
MSCGGGTSGGNSHIGNSVLRVGRSTARIAGVPPQGSWRLPGKVDAWLLEPNSEIGSKEPGYAVAHLTPSGEFQIGPRWVISLFAVLFAVLASPVIGLNSKGIQFGFQKALFQKKTVAMGVLERQDHLANADCLFCIAGPRVFMHVFLFDFVRVFPICLFIFNLFFWPTLDFQDQQQRCPICLRRVTNPTSVGQPSEIFELICMGGIPYYMFLKYRAIGSAHSVYCTSMLRGGSYLPIQLFGRTENNRTILDAPQIS